MKKKYSWEGSARILEDTLSSISEKEVLMGTVVGMNKKEVVINIGYKSEGVVPLSEFRYKADLKLAIDSDGNSLPAGFNWTHLQLCKRLSNRYSDFKQNNGFYKILKELQVNPKLCIKRQHNPLSPKSSKTMFYNSSILPYFDKHYTLNL